MATLDEAQVLKPDATPSSVLPFIIPKSSAKVSLILSCVGMNELKGKPAGFDLSVAHTGPSLMRKGTTLWADAPRAEWLTWPPMYAPNARRSVACPLGSAGTPRYGRSRDLLAVVCSTGSPFWGSTAPLSTR